MPTVIVTPPAIVQVRNGVSTNPRINAIDYGAGKNQLTAASDLSLVGAVDGGVITYHLATNTFTVNSGISTLTNIDNGFF
jgi:hypothetical protein